MFVVIINRKSVTVCNKLSVLFLAVVNLFNSFEGLVYFPKVSVVLVFIGSLVSSNSCLTLEAAMGGKLIDPIKSDSCVDFSSFLMLIFRG